MKRTVYAFIILVMASTAVGCGNSGKPREDITSPSASVGNDESGSHTDKKAIQI